MGLKKVETVSWRAHPDPEESSANAETAFTAAGRRDLGRGNLIARKLYVLGIRTALDLALTNPAFVRKNFSIVLERTVRELNGKSCMSLEEAPPAKQQIVCSRSFGEKITEYDSLRQAVCQYAERVSEKLRKERQYYLLPAYFRFHQNVSIRR